MHDVNIRIRHIWGRFNMLALRLDKPVNTEWSLDQTVANCIFQMLNFPIVDLFASWFNHKLPLYVSPVPENQTLAVDALSMDWNNLPCLCISSSSSDTNYSHQYMSIMVQNSSDYSYVASTSVVLWGVTIISISSNSTSTLSRSTDTSKWKFSTSKPPNTRPSL